jgi:hypothetical protein
MVEYEYNIEKKVARVKIHNEEKYEKQQQICSFVLILVSVAIPLETLTVEKKRQS